MIPREQDILAAVRAEFALPARGVTPGGRGALGEIWRLHVDGRPDLAVKLSTEEPSESTVSIQVAHSVRMAGAGVRVAAEVPNRHGGYVSRVEAGWLRVSEWVDGAKPDEADPKTPPRLGEVLGRMHAHTTSASSAPSGWFSEPPPMERVEDLVVSAENADPRWEGRLVASLPILRSLAGITKVPGALLWCHRDLHPDNVLLTREGQFAVLDWDCLGPADPSQELASVLLHWFADHSGARLEAARAFCAAYRAAGGTGKIMGVEDFAMHLATRLNFLARQLEVVTDALSAPGNVRWAVAEIEETLRFLPTIRVLDRCVVHLARWS